VSIEGVGILRVIEKERQFGRFCRHGVCPFLGSAPNTMMGPRSTCRTLQGLTSENSILLGTGVKIALAALDFHAVGVALPGHGPLG
jgi:hypothetical protein